MDDQSTREQKEALAAELEAEMAEVCGVMNAATGRLVRLIARVLETESWQGWGIRSASHWVAWRCGVSPARARTLVLMARRLQELPETGAALDAGELCEDQVAVICRHAPATIDAEAATLAHSATVAQLRRVLGGYSFNDESTADPTEPTDTQPPERPEEPRRVSFGSTDRGTWSLSAELPVDEGAVVERAIVAARDELFRAGEGEASPTPRPHHVDWADAFLAMADRSLGGERRPHGERHLVLLHIGTQAQDTQAQDTEARGTEAPGTEASVATGGHLHLGPGLEPGLRRFLSCDVRIRPVLEEGGRAVSVGRAFRTVPDRTRMVVEERDRGCRVPGCDRSRWLHVHHMQHWEDGGGSDTPNLICLCQTHHRLHHLGKLGISGDADDPDGVTFTDERGRALSSCGRPVPPGQAIDAAARRLDLPTGGWSPPTGERFDPHWVHFNEPAC